MGVNPYAVCITTVNEADSIGALVDWFVGRSFDVYVFDDASTDDTPERAKRAGARVFGNQRRQGIGPCLLSAWLVAGWKHSRIVQIDAGGSHDPEDSLRLLGVDADVVLGSRFMSGSKYQGRPFRAMMSRLASTMCNAAQAGAHWSDWTSGYRVFSQKALHALTRHTYKAKMNGWQIEVLARAGAEGLTIAEVPISYRAGRSSFNWHIVAEAFGVWLNMMLNISPVRESA